MKILVVCVAIALSCLSVAMAQVDVTGTWDLTTTTQRGEQTQKIEISQQGESLKVVMEGRRGGKVEAEGTVRDAEISWSVTRKNQRGEFTLTYTGTIEGDTMKGKVQMQGGRSRDWTALKK